MNTMPARDKAELQNHLEALGVQQGDTLFVHSSFKSLGPVAGGAGTVVDALQAAVGPEGLLLMPSFHLIRGDDRARLWDHATTPSTVGWLTEYFRRMRDTHRSDHYSHSVAARGPGAEDFVAGHLSQEGPPSSWDRLPWGRTYGTHSPMNRAYRRGGKLLMLGVDYETSTYIHFVEVLYWDHLRRTDPHAPQPRLDRPRLGAWWDDHGRPARGLVGDSPSRLFAIDSYVDALLAEVVAAPGRYEPPPR